MTLTEAETTFLETHHFAAMITTDDGGVPEAVRLGVAPTMPGEGRFSHRSEVHRTYGLG